MNLRNLATIDQALQVANHPNTRVYFSQFGEDAIVLSMLQTLKMERGGFYVDVGAFHPAFLSNTRMLNLLGWTGVNIEANPNGIALFNRERPNDRNVQAVVSDERGEVEFGIYEAAAISTADPVTRALYERDGRSKLVQALKMQTRTLREILAETVPEGRRIDLMSVDVEGFDLKVLRSNDWQRFAPRFLLVEDQSLSLLDRPTSAIFEFLKPLGYRLASQAFITSIYLRDQLPA